MSRSDLAVQSWSPLWFFLRVVRETVLVEAREEFDLSIFLRDERSYWLVIGVATRLLVLHLDEDGPPPADNSIPFVVPPLVECWKWEDILKDPIVQSKIPDS